VSFFYVYALLDPRKPGKFSYRGSDIVFDFEPFYIGKGEGNRINEHDCEIYYNSRYRKSCKIRKIFHETGGLHLKIKLFENLLEDVSFELEIFLIKQIGRIDNQKGPLTNHTDGGEGISGYVFSEESRLKMSQSRIGIILSKETRQKMASSRMGEKNHQFGKVRTKEHRERLGLSRRGKVHTKETKMKMSLSHKNPSEEIRRKIGEASKNRVVSSETREKLRQKAKDMWLLRKQG